MGLLASNTTGLSGMTALLADDMLANKLGVIESMPTNIWARKHPFRSILNC
jgi:hypothetical protein